MTNDFDLKSIRKSLNAMRNKHGADTPTGHTCSNLTEQLANYPQAGRMVSRLMTCCPPPDPDRTPRTQ